MSVYRISSDPYSKYSIPALRLLFGESSSRELPSSPLESSQKPPAQQPKPQPSYPRWVAPSVTDTFSYTTPVQAQTRIESLLNGGQIFGKVQTMLESAKSSVYVNLYNFQNPSLYPEKSSSPDTAGAAIQAQLVDRLVALKEKGLKVKVIIDNHFDRELNESHNDRTIKYLRSKGIEVLTYPDFAKISHVKLLVVDDHFAMIGGMNWGNHSATNHDAAVFIEGPDVRNLYNEIFKTDWLTSGGKASDISTLPSFPEGKIKVLTTSPPESVDGGAREIYQEILTQIGNAQESIYAELFVLTQRDIIDNLIFAHKRLKNAGKEGVKLLVDPGLYFSFPNTRKGVQRLASAGIPIQFFKTNRETEEKLHAKWAVFDKKTLVIGSANWSNVGLLAETADSSPKGPKIESNHEADVLIESPTLAKAFVDQFNFDWKNCTFPILMKAEDGSGRWTPIKPSSPPLPNPEPKFA